MRVPTIAARLFLVAVAAIGATQVQGQGAAAPAFEVASIKPSNPDASNPLSALPMIMPAPGGRLTGTNVALRQLVLTAYELQDFQLVGGPSWVTSRKFDLNAKAGNPDATGKEIAAMLKTLLADRFQLKAHMETRDVPVGVLVVARSDGKLGPKLKVSTANCPSAEEQSEKFREALSKGGPAAVQSLMGQPGGECSMMPSIANGGNLSAGMGLGMKGQPISTLVALLTQFTGKTIQDKTGLTGRYDFELTFDPEVLLRMVSQLGINIPAGALPPSTAPSLLTSLNEQLGLKLENEKAPGQVLVIDSAELPMPD